MQLKRIPTAVKHQEEEEQQQHCALSLREPIHFQRGRKLVRLHVEGRVVISPGTKNNHVACDVGSHADLRPLCHVSSGFCGGGSRVPSRVVHSGHTKAPAEGGEEHSGAEGGEEAGGASGAGLYQCDQPEGAVGVHPQGRTRKEPA